jgi:hypothetical protein
VPSVKNFQLVEQGDRDTVLMQFGKVGEDRFHMDFRAPLTAVQAFAIVLSQLLMHTHAGGVERTMQLAA